MNKRIARTLESLSKSTFRSGFKLNEKDLSYIRDKGIDTIKTHAADFITARIAPRFPKNDGKQTPMKGTPHLSPSTPQQPAAGLVFKNGMGLEKTRP